jgi:phosphatidylglycerol:prolipoprotein diacylglycerol transferase
LTYLLDISIGIDPNIGRIFGLLLTWHGFFTAVGIVAGVWLAVRVANTDRVGIDPDTAYTLGMVIVFCGIIGARALYVAENYGDPGSGLDNVWDVFRINEGGISIYGAILGGAVGGWVWGLWKKLPCAPGADAAALGMLIGLAIGRLGDVINGEHFAKHSDLPWAVTYTHPNSTAFAREAMHPAVAYELLGDLVILGLLALLWRRSPKGGVVFSLAFLLYAIMRFGVSLLRIDSEDVMAGLSTPQFISALVIPVALGLLVFFSVRKEPDYPRFAYAPDRVQRSSTPRAERRRRVRQRGAGTTSGTGRASR